METSAGVRQAAALAIRGHITATTTSTTGIMDPITISTTPPSQRAPPSRPARPSRLAPPTSIRGGITTAGGTAAMPARPAGIRGGRTAGTTPGTQSRYNRLRFWRAELVPGRRRPYQFNTNTADDAEATGGATYVWPNQYYLYTNPSTYNYSAFPDSYYLHKGPGMAEQTRGLMAHGPGPKSPPPKGKAKQ